MRVYPTNYSIPQVNDPAVVERIRRERGLDKPFTEQYLNYITGVVTRFDFGESYKYVGQNVGDLIRPRIWNSVQLGLFGLSIGVLVGTALGLLAALKQGSWIDPVIVTSALFLSSLPVFILQPVLAVLLSRTLRLLPSSGWEPGLFGLQLLSPYVDLFAALEARLGGASPGAEEGAGGGDDCLASTCRPAAGNGAATSSAPAPGISANSSTVRKPFKTSQKLSLRLQRQQKRLYLQKGAVSN